MIPYENLQKVNTPFFHKLEQAASNTIKSGWYILGEQVVNFEQDFANYCNIKHAIGVANGLDALILALDALQLPKGGEVLISANSYIACSIAILRTGLTPVFVEPETIRLQLDAQQLEKHLSSKTVAIMAVHMYGRMCDMPAITAFAHEHGLKVVEDCAQAHGASIDGKKAGTWGDVGCYSFYPTKNLGCLGDGGAVICADNEIANRIRSLRNYGSQQKYHNKYIGYNSRLDELQAAFLSVKLPELDAMNAHKQKLADIYNHELASFFSIPVTPANFVDVHHIYPILVDNRDEFRSYLLDNGIGTEVHYPIPPHKQEAMTNFHHLNLPVSEDIHSRIVSLPISFCHTNNDVRQIADTIKVYIREKI